MDNYIERPLPSIPIKETECANIGENFLLWRSSYKDLPLKRKAYLYNKDIAFFARIKINLDIKEQELFSSTDAEIFSYQDLDFIAHSDMSNAKMSCLIDLSKSSRLMIKNNRLIIEPLIAKVN